MVKLFKAIKSWFENADRQALERYLSKAQNYADLEDRMRKWQSKQNKFCW